MGTTQSEPKVEEWTLVDNVRHKGIELKTKEWTVIDGVEYKKATVKEGRGSEGVQKIRKALTEMNLIFFEEVCIRECKRKKLLRFDFLVLRPEADPLLIEFDGEQHFQHVAKFHKNSPKALQLQQERDGIKNLFVAGKVHFLRISARAMKDGVNLSPLLDTLVGDKKQLFHGPEYGEGSWCKVAVGKEAEKDGGAFIFMMIAGVVALLLRK